MTEKCPQEKADVIRVSDADLAERYEAWIAEKVAAAPALAPWQIEKLRALLHSGRA